MLPVSFLSVPHKLITVFLVMRRPIYYVDADYSLTRSDTVVLFSTSFCICWDTSSRWTTSSSSDSWTARLPDTLSSDTLTVCFISVVHRMHTHSYFLQVSRLRLAPWDKVSRTLSVWPSLNRILAPFTTAMNLTLLTTTHTVRVLGGPHIHRY